MPQKPKRPCRYPGCPGFCEQGQVFLKQHPLCAFCQAEGKIVPATVVDHIIPHRGDQRLFWDQTNWESLCKECHDKKTGSGL